MASKIVIVGASSGAGRALSNELASTGSDLVLVARSERDIESLCSDLKLKYDGTCFAKHYDVENTDCELSELFSECQKVLGDIDAVIFSVGYVDPDDSPIADWDIVKKVSMANYLGIVRTLNPFIRYFKEKGAGQIIAFSSIAAIAPRRRNTIYSAAKIALESYLKGLRHYLQAKGVVVKIYALGYMDTSMSYGQKMFFPVCSVEKVARHVVSNMDKDFCKVYYPRYWGCIAWLIQRLPWVIYKRLNF